MANVLPRFHEAANIFPMMSDDGFAAFLADVRVKGIIHPVVTWTDSKGRKWLLDGRNRAKAWKVLADEGVEMDGKLIELPEYEYHGSEEEALSYVIACNMHRRDLSSSQRAAVAIRANMLAHRYRAKADPSNPQVIEGDLAAKIAEMVGSNRTYIFRCQKILEYSPALLKQVVEGQLSIPQALAAMKAEKDAADTAENGAEGDEELVPENAILDGLKDPVPEEWGATFSTRDAYAEVIRIIRTCSNQIELLAEGPGKHWLEAEEVLAFLRNAKRLLNAAKPHALCPECMGDKKVEVPGKKRKQRCERCEGRGYVNKARYQGQTTIADDPETQTEAQPEPEAQPEMKEPKPNRKKRSQKSAEPQGEGKDAQDTERPANNKPEPAIGSTKEDAQEEDKDPVRERQSEARALRDEMIESLPADA
jgi:ParB-like chromosome segregation protein Spo0J